VPAADVARGTGNTSEDARLANPALLDFSLRPGSPALGSGANGLDMGAKVPAGASLTGVPVGTTGRTTATIAVGGPGAVAYRYRLDGGAWGAEQALSTPITLSGLSNGQHTLQVATKNSAGAWQADADAAARTWTVNTSVPAVRINEVLAQSTGGPDLIELYNDSDATVSLTAMAITDDPTKPRQFVFPSGTVIAPGGYLVLYADSASTPAGIHTKFSLRAGGEGVWLYDTTARGGGLLDSVQFGPQLPDLSIGRLTNGSWGLTTPTFGSANVAQRTGDPSTLKLNEWLADAAAGGDDFVELYNPDALPVPLAGLSLTDHMGGAPGRSPAAPLSFIPARGWLAYPADGNNAPDEVNFKLSADGGQLGLVNLATGKLIDRDVYGPQRTGVSQGRTPDGGAGVSNLPVPTPGFSNVQAAPSTLPLRVTEIMYHPPEQRPGSEYSAKDLEFVELQNTSAAPISLRGVKFTVGVTFVFPDVTLQPGQYAVVASNLQAFQAKYGSGRNVLGVFNGDLDDSGERLRLEDLTGATVLDFAYGDSAWYPLTDGAGYSLVINDPQAPASTWGLKQSWHAGNAPGGSPGVVEGAPVAAVLSRQVFYNHSGFDGNNAAANASDDGAAATDKRALLPGEAASFANLTGYSRGLNGIFIDVRNFAAAPTASDFIFRRGTGGDPASWGLAPNPTITLRPGAGVGGSDRITLTWADGAVRNTWLQVTVKPGGNTGLSAADVFYFGNLVGETGRNAGATFTVDATDLAEVRRHLSSSSVPAGSEFDLDKDGRVTSADYLVARDAQSRATLRAFTAPGITPLAASVFGNAPITPTRGAPARRQASGITSALLA
jgi:hypothetical protein